MSLFSNEDFFDEKPKLPQGEAVLPSQMGINAPKAPVKVVKAKPIVPPKKWELEIKEEPYEVKEGEFKEYYALNPYRRASLPSVNYFKILQGLPIVNVPKSDVDYWKYFDDEAQKRAYIKREFIAKPVPI